MDPTISKGREFFIDLESGVDSKINEEECSNDGFSKNEGVVDCLDDFSISIDRALENGILVDGRLSGGEKEFLLEKVGIERSSEKTHRKPPKPPRPPKSPSLDAADRKLVQEIAERATLKKARIERMKALKKLKNGKGGSSSSSFCALVITVVFCAIIIWQGVFRTSSSDPGFHGSPESLLRNSVHYDRNLSAVPLSSSFLEQVSGLSGHGEASKDRS